VSPISPQQKTDPQKKRKKERGKNEEKKKKREQGLKSKRGETSYEEAPCFKRKKRKKRGWNLQAAGRDSIERKKGDHIFL
jgi:hypothetical protein